MRARLSMLTLPLIAFAAQPGAAQESAAPFDAPVVVLPVDSAPFQKLLDFDGDGDLDAVGHRVTTAGFYGSTEVSVQVWRNDGLGRFAPVYEDVAPAPSSVSALLPMRLAVADLNGDGLDDFVLGGGNVVWKYTSVHGAGFAKSAVSATAGGGAVRDVLAADFDGDGAVDILALEHNRVTVLWSNGSVMTSLVDMSGAERALLTETDGDALPDVAAVASGTLTLLAFDGQVITPYYPSIGVSQAGLLADSADIDLDGDEDVVSFGMAPNRYQVLRRTGPTSWSLESPVAGGPAEYLIDIDLDGDPDGVCCGGGGGGGGGNPGPYPPLDFVSKFEIATNLGGGAFAPAFEMEGLGSKSLAGAADLDGDGDVDLLAGRCVYFARGAPPVPPLLASLGASVDLTDHLVDWDLDGDVDVTLAGGPNPWRNYGDGSFGGWPNWPIETIAPGIYSPSDSILGDFDGDGAVDLIRSLFLLPPGGTATFLEAFLWRNQGGAGLVPVGPAAASGTPFHFPGYQLPPDGTRVRDLDGDGDLDVACRSVGLPVSQARLFLNDGGGFFSLAETWSDLSLDAVADFDQDGLPDALASTFYTPGYIYGPWRLYLRPGTGGPPGALFGPAQPVFESTVMVTLQHPISIADLDADGYLDVAATDAGAQVVLFQNPIPHGAGPQWIVRKPFPPFTLDSYGRVHPADVNGDGYQDLIVGPLNGAPNARTVYLFEPAAAGAILTAHAYEAGVTQILAGRYPADFDGDGDVDFGGQTVARNASFHGADAGFRQQYGASSTGSGGFGPILGASGPFRVGEPVKLLLRGASPGSITFLDVAPSKAQYPGFPTPQTTCWIDVFSATLLKFALPSGGIPGVPGTGGYAVPVSVVPGMVGPHFELQAFVIDLATPGFVSASNGLTLAFGP